MTQTFQLDRHPDAESLSAFAERALPEWEQRQVMSHLAGCGRCREIVFLAQEVAEGVVEAQVAGQRGAGTWWKTWRFVWVPAAVCTAMVVAGINFELTRGKPTSETGFIVKSAEPQTSVSGVGLTAAAPALAVRQSDEAGIAHSRAAAKPLARLSKRSEAASITVVPQTPIAQPGSMSAGLPTGDLSKNSQQGAPPGPAGNVVKPANSFSTTQTVAVEASAQILSETPSVSSTFSSASLQSAPSPDKKVATRSRSSFAKASPVRKQSMTSASQVNAAKSQAVVVTGEDSLAPVRATAPARATGAMGQSAANFSISAGAISSSADAFAARSALDARLPSGLAAVSTAATQGHLVAIDPTGQVFLSLDLGKTWTSVAMPWKGRAVTVRGSSTSGTNSQVTTDTISVARFEIVTDSGALWTSVDGHDWNPKLP